MTSVYGCSWAIGAKCMAIGEDDTHDAPLEVFFFFYSTWRGFLVRIDVSTSMCLNAWYETH